MAASPDADDVLRRAVELQAARDEALAQQTANEQAAAEMGIEPATLRQAERELDARQQAAVSAATLRRQYAIAARWLLALVLMGLLIGWGMARRPLPWVESFDGAALRWALVANAGTDAHAEFLEHQALRGGSVKVVVGHFAPQADGKFFANLNRPGPLDLAPHRFVHFCSRGQGLDVVRLYLEAGDVRWRSPPVRLGPQWTENRLPMYTFERQERRGDDWRTRGYESPATVANVSFKFGQFMNDSAAHGEAEIDDLRFDPFR